MLGRWPVGMGYEIWETGGDACARARGREEGKEKEELNKIERKER